MEGQISDIVGGDWSQGSLIDVRYQAVKCRLQNGLHSFAEIKVEFTSLTENTCSRPEGKHQNWAVY